MFSIFLFNNNNGSSIGGNIDEISLAIILRYFPLCRVFCKISDIVLSLCRKIGAAFIPHVKKKKINKSKNYFLNYFLMTRMDTEL